MRSADLKQIEILNTLIGVNTNRIECYNFIGAKTDISVLQVLFARLAETSMQCRSALIDEVYKLGGKPLTGTLVTREFFKAWLDIHAALNAEDHKAILDACFYEEGVVTDTYIKFLSTSSENMPGYLIQLLSEHLEVLQVNAAMVNNLRSALLSAA